MKAKVPIAVAQSLSELVAQYSFVYQNLVSVLGSTDIAV